MSRLRRWHKIDSATVVAIDDFGRANACRRISYDQ